MLVLITGGAGFIGSHLVRDLLQHGHAVRVLDNLDPQVHRSQERPADLHPDAELVIGDVRDADCVARSLRGADAVVHLAAKVGVGQSMYEIESYVGVNEQGTATLLQQLLATPVRKLLVASSMSIYGEGLFADTQGRRIDGIQRSQDELRRGQWDPCDATTGEPLRPLPTPEDKRPMLSSVYALGKFAQERMCLMAGAAYGLETTALRFFNVYGPGQALSNPYTGVLAIFAARLLNGQPPLVFEDGRQRRDFVHVSDVARACRIALETGAGAGQALNVGSGNSISIGEVADRLIAAMGVSDIRPHITGQFRMGDIRHCFADATRARAVLGFQAEVPFDDGLRDLVGWLVSQSAVDHSEQALSELARRGLVA